MSRVTLWHRTPAAHLPDIEVEGLRTRIDLSARLGPVGDFDAAAPGRFAHGRRVSGWLAREQADTAAVRAQCGAGLVSFTVDPAKAVAQPASLRVRDPQVAWAAARPLRDWLAEAAAGAALPLDLEVHQDQPVRAKLVAIHAPTFAADELGVHAPLVAALADTDRLAAKVLVHLLLAASDGDADTAAYRAACALAWRDVPDAADLARRVGRAEAAAVIEAVLVEQADEAPACVAELTGLVDALQAEATAQDMTFDDVMLARSEQALDRITA
jgi:hypothetical protein